MSHFKSIKESKFMTMNSDELSRVKGGGICLLCMKRARYNKRGEQLSGVEIVNPQN